MLTSLFLNLSLHTTDPPFRLQDPALLRYTIATFVTASLSLHPAYSFLYTKACGLYITKKGQMNMTDTTIPAAQEEGKQVEGEPGKMIVFDIRKLVRLREEQPFVQILSDIGAARLVLFTFKAGQELKEHSTSSQILVQVLRGRVTFAANGSSVKLQAGMVLQLEGNVPHSIVAQTSAVVLLTMVPSPASRSPEHRAFQGVVPLTMRTPGDDAGYC